MMKTGKMFIFYKPMQKGHSIFNETQPMLFKQTAHGNCSSHKLSIAHSDSLCSVAHPHSRVAGIHYSPVNSALFISPPVRRFVT